MFEKGLPTSADVNLGEMKKVRWISDRVWTLNPVDVVAASQRAVARLGFARVGLVVGFLPWSGQLFQLSNHSPSIIILG